MIFRDGYHTLTRPFDNGARGVRHTCYSSRPRFHLRQSRTFFALTQAHILREPAPCGRINLKYRPRLSPRPIDASLAQLAKCYASTSSPPADIAILGGGITGLAAAFYLSERLPKAKITIYESRHELGGWIKSKAVDVGHGEVLFESGPRSLRPQPPNGALALELAQKLDLLQDTLFVSRHSPAARHRFIYFPDRLVKMPGPGQSLFDILRTLLSEPIFNGAILSGLAEFVKEKRPDSLEDESVGSFISRRFSPDIANNMASALFHGIYAGDIWKLSARSILQGQWFTERKYGSLLRAGLAAWQTKSTWNFCDDFLVDMRCRQMFETWSDSMKLQLKDCSIFTFSKGVGMLAERLEQRLSSLSNVHIKKSSMVERVTKVPQSSDIKITTRSDHLDKSHTENEEISHTHVISTLSPTILHGITAPTIDRSSHGPKSVEDYSNLLGTRATTVSVVNLYFQTPELLQKLSPPRTTSRNVSPGGGLQGFGYLIPLTVPLSQNPERALGVIFDSDISPSLYTSVPKDKIGTKLTVMLGGHYWDGWAAYPSQQDAIEMAREVLKRHLGITEKLITAQATLQRDCIPQYEVGFSKRMETAASAVGNIWNGRLLVAGSWYTGVGVNDCIRGAYDVAKGLVEDLNGETVLKLTHPRTGLERFQYGRPMLRERRQSERGRSVVSVLEMDDAALALGYPKAIENTIKDMELTDGDVMKK